MDARRAYRRCLFSAAALFLCMQALTNSAPAAEQVNLRLRLAWGEGARRSWQAAISIDNGSLSEVRRLGLSPDVPGAFVNDGRNLNLAARSASSYDGVDVLVTAPLDAQFLVELTPSDQPMAARRFTVPLSDLVTGFRKEVLDDFGGQRNWLEIRRAPGDRLRIEANRQNFVFSPGEALAIDVRPHLVRLESNIAIRMSVGVYSAAGEELKVDQRNLETDADGELPASGPMNIAIPQEEGVYEIRVTLSRNRLTDRFANPLNKSAPLMRRKLQFAVIDDRPQPRPTPGEWREIGEINPEKPGWWGRMKGITQLSVLPGFQSERPLGKKHYTTREVGDETLLELAPGDFQAIPLPMDRVGRPHIIEVEYAANARQTLGISIVEPNAAGAVAPIGLDSGVDVPIAFDLPELRLERHRLICWPRTASPLLLLTNRSDDTPALFKTIRVLAGPDRLPPAVSSTAGAGGRQLTAYYDKPLFPENFSAPEALDEGVNRLHDDWTTFYQGGRRLVEYLQHAGFNAAVISAACEGSAIYPSDLLEPSPKYDTGAFFLTAQDPRPKDVLEMLFRLFDREGLQLTPAIQFASPLPELERKLRQGQTGIELVDGNGTSWIEVYGSRKGLAPYYNPLDPNVQMAMRNVVVEMVHKYGRHRSFAGVALQLGPDTFSQLPGELWGLDQATWNRFTTEARIELSKRELLEGYDRENQLAGEELTAWLESEEGQTWQGARDQWRLWRAAKLAELHQAMRNDITGRRPDAKLLLLGGALLTGPEMHRALRPTLPRQQDVGAALTAAGFDSSQIGDDDAIVLPRPQRIGPLSSLYSQANNLETRSSAAVDEAFHPDRSRAVLFYHEEQILPLPAFDRENPLGVRSSFTKLISHLAPSAEHNRRRFVHSVVAFDARSIIDGGWMLPLGQEDATREVIDAYRLLPAERFSDAPVRGAATEHVAVRYLHHNGRTFIYAASDLPWPTRVEMKLANTAGAPINVLGARNLPPPQIEANDVKWILDLKPYDLAAASINVPNVAVTEWTHVVTTPVRGQLKQRIQELDSRLNLLRQQQPMPVLRNPGFELPPAGPQQQLPGWLHARNVGLTAEADPNNPHQGGQSLHLSSKGNVLWVRSERFAPPKTGRCSVLMWLKVAGAQQQPNLRLAIEAIENEKPYYQYTDVGAGTNHPLKADWGTPFLFNVDDLPPSGLTQFQVGFDLMGAGNVWVDDVEVYDTYFQDNELRELQKNIAQAAFRCDKGDFAECHRFLDSYWAHFLMRFVKLPPAPKVARQVPVVQQPAAEPAREAPMPVEEKKEPTNWQKVKQYIPRFLFGGGK